MDTQSDDPETLPRRGSAIHALLTSDREKRRRSLRRFKLINKFAVPLYRVGLLPLLGFGRAGLLLITRGRKTGRKRFTPLEYQRIDGVVHIFSGRGSKADWFRNLKANPDEVEIQIGFHTLTPEVEIVEGETEKEEILRWYVANHPFLASKLMGWDPVKDDPEKTDLFPLASMLEILRLRSV